MKQWMLLCLIALVPLTSEAGTMRCKSALISEGDSSFNMQKKCGQPQMKEDIIDERLLDAPKIGERWTYQKNEQDIPQAVTIMNSKVVQIEDVSR